MRGVWKIFVCFRSEWPVWDVRRVGGRMQHMKCLILSLVLALLVLAIFHLQLRTEVSQLKASQVTQNTSTKNTQQQEALFHIFQILGFASCLVQRSCPG